MRLPEIYIISDISHRVFGDLQDFVYALHHWQFPVLSAAPCLVASLEVIAR